MYAFVYGLDGAPGARREFFHARRDWKERERARRLAEPTENETLFLRLPLCFMAPRRH